MSQPKQSPQGKQTQKFAPQNTSSSKASSKVGKTPAKWWRNKNIYLPLLGILLLTALLYAPYLGNDFFNWDDPDYVYENTTIRELNAQSIVTFFTEFRSSNYHPLTWLSLAMNYAVHGNDPWGYHFINLLLHLANVLLVFVFVYKLCDQKADIALFVTLFFGIHPLHIESVAWVTERKDVLYVLFMLPALWYYLRQLEKPSASNYALVLVFYLLSLLSKPSAVIFPLLLLCVDYLKGRPIQPRLIIEKIPHFALSVLFGILTILAQKDSAIGEFEQYSLFQRICFANYGFMMYIVKLFFPVSQSVLYPYPIVAAGLPVQFLIAPLFTAATIAGLVWSRKFTRVGIFGVAFYFFNIVLVIQFMSVGEAIMSERYTYMSYIGLLIIVGYLFHALLQKESLKIPMLALLGLFTVAFSIKTFERLKLWKNSDLLWTDVINQYPNRTPTAYNNRGHYRRNKKLYQEAISDLSTAIQLHPKYHLAFVNRGNTYFSLQRNDEAFADYTKSIELKADYPEGYGNRGSVYFQKGQYDLAMQDYNKALELKKEYPDAYLNRAVTLSVLNKHEEAVPDYTQYIKYMQDEPNPKAYNWRGMSYQQLKQPSKALEDFNRAIQLDGKNTEFLLNRSQLNSAMGNKAQARADAQKVRELGGKVDDAYWGTLQ